MEVRIIRVEGCESRFGYDPGLKGYRPDLLVCTYYAFAMVLYLPSYCLCHRAVFVTSTVFFGIIMLSSLSPVSWCLCYGIVVAACCLSYCVFAIVFYRAVFLIVLFLVSHCLCYVLCGLWYRALTSSNKLKFLTVFDSFWQFLTVKKNSVSFPYSAYLARNFPNSVPWPQNPTVAGPNYRSVLIFKEK